MDFMWSLRGSDEHAAGAAMRRRQRRLRSWLRHERMTVAMLLAAREHHTTPRGRLARSGEWVREEVHGQAPEEPHAAGVQHFFLDDDEPPAVKGSRPDRLPAVSGPQERVPRRIVEQIVVVQLLLLYRRRWTQW